MVFDLYSSSYLLFNKIMNLNKRIIETNDGSGSIPAKKLKYNHQAADLDKINEIIAKNFNEEIIYKQHEIEKINERIFETQNMLDKLRALVLCRYYSLNGNLSLNQFINHPALLEFKREILEKYDLTMPKLLSNTDLYNHKFESKLHQNHHHQQESKEENNVKLHLIKLCVGNVSKYLNINKPQKEHCLNQTSIYDDNLISHKWMVYVRSSNCKNIDLYIKKVVFHLHQSYKPNDIIEINKPPFQLTKRGWGEFPIHVQIHFKDARNKRMDIIHQLKLDWTLTGLQTFGGETIKEAELNIYSNDYIDDKQIVNKKKENQLENQQKHDKEESKELSKNNLDELEKKIKTVDQCSTSESPNVTFADLFTKSLNKNDLSNQHNHDYDEDDYELINPTTGPISCIDELILDLTNNSFDLSNHNSEFESSSNLIDTFLTNHSSMPATPMATSEASNLIEHNAQSEQQYVEASAHTITQPVVSVSTTSLQKPKNSNQNKSSIDDLLNIRLKTKPLIPNLIQPLSTINISSITPSKSSPTLQTTNTTIKPNSVISLSNNINKGPTITSITPVKLVELKSSPKQQNVPIVQQVKPVTTLLNKPASFTTKIKTSNSAIITPTASSSTSTKSRPQITPVVKNEQNYHQQQDLNLFKPASNNLSSINQNKKCVIYKVESKDVNKNKQEPQKLIEQHKKQLQKNIVKQELTPQERANPLLNDHNTSLFTKMKSKNHIIKTVTTKKVENNNNQENQNKIHLPENQDNNNKNSINKINETANASVSTAATTNTPLPITKSKTTTSNANVSIKQNETKIYTINDSLLNDVVKSLNNFDNYENYLKIAQKYSPLINENPNKIHLPFCANSINEYFKWPYAKRRANEWMRALNVKRRVNSMITKTKSNNSQIVQWSTKDVLIWLRAHGYTPLDHKINSRINKYSKILNDPNNNQNVCKNISDCNYISSLTPYDKLLNDERIDLNLNEESNKMIEIDVVGNSDSSDDLNSFGKELINKKLTKNMENIELNKNYDHLLQMSNGAKYVKEQLNIIDIKTNPINLSSNTACKLVEEFMFVVARHFCEDLIRDTSSNIYSKSSSQAKTNNNSKIHNIKNCNQYITKINVLDVFNTICNNNKYDFLTNSYMASINAKSAAKENTK